MFPMRLALERAARHFPNLIAMIKEDGSQESWHNHIDCVARLAGVFCDLDLAPSARFAILAPNSVDQATLIHAGYWSGRVPVPLNFRLSTGELVAMLQKSSAQVLFVSTDYLNVAHKILGDGWGGQVLLIGTGRDDICLLYTSPSPRDVEESRMPSSA